MPLQTENLVMVALEVDGDSPPNQYQPQLPSGIHLRWAFQRNLGFPFYGFYLFRRPHEPVELQCLTAHIGHFTEGYQFSNSTLFGNFGTLTSDINFHLLSQFSRPTVEFDLGQRQHISLHLPDSVIAFTITVTVGFKQNGTVEITGLSENRRGITAEAIPVLQKVIYGEAGDEKSASIYFDILTGVRISGDAGAIIDICYLPIDHVMGGSWEPLENLENPISLPIQHPDYPCADREEDVDSSRQKADSRITYTNDYHRKFTQRFPINLASGNAIVTTGSHIVTGEGSNWTNILAGKAIRFGSHSQKFYSIQKVISRDRILLSRPYQGTSATRTEPYHILEDDFAQLHDTLAILIQGGPTSRPMADRVLPSTIYEEGKVQVRAGQTKVDGIGTNWLGDYIGAKFQVIHRQGTGAFVSMGAIRVKVTGSTLTLDVVGQEVRFSGDKRRYIIRRIQDNYIFILDRPYQGETRTTQFEILEKQVYTIVSVINPDEIRLDLPYSGLSRQDLSYRLFFNLGEEDNEHGAPHPVGLYPMDMVLMTALHADFAQSLGLYWIDQTVEEGESYDYLIIGDYHGTFIGKPIEDVLHVVRDPSYDFQDSEGFIVFNKSMQSTHALARPEELQSYSIPTDFEHEYISRGDGIPKLLFRIGLSWRMEDVMTKQGTILPDRPLFYHVFRAMNSDQESDAAMLTIEYDPPRQARSPILASRHITHPRYSTESPPGWPEAPLFFIDQKRREGQYTYWIAGMDLFGRHSAYSMPTTITLSDELPPPMPPGVQAWALDPQDPTVYQDCVFDNWCRELTAANWHQELSVLAQQNLIGLRVKWGWTYRQMRQAPDVVSFKIHYKADKFNSITGKTLQVEAIQGNRTRVYTNIPNDRPENAFVNAWLRVKGHEYRIVESLERSPLQLIVVGSGNVRPATNADCVIREDSLVADKWDQVLIEVDYEDDSFYSEMIVVTPETPILEGQGAILSGRNSNKILLGGNPDLSDDTIIGESIYFEKDTVRFDKSYLILAINNISKEVLLDGSPSFEGATLWKVGTYTRVYETFLPLPSDSPRIRIPLQTSRLTPIAYAQVGVNAVDCSNNNGPVGGPATIFRVHRQLPPKPSLPPIFETEKVYATPADYHGQSFYTVRWQPLTSEDGAGFEPLSCHIFRAMDDSLFKTDWAWRKNNSDTNLSGDDQSVFPPEFLGPEDAKQARRSAVREEVNGLRSRIKDISNINELRSIYESLSPDTHRIIAGLKHTEPAFVQITIQPLDPFDSNNDDRRGPDDSEEYAPSNTLRAYQDTLDGKSRNAYFYRYGFVDKAHNRSGDLSLATPPVVLPDVVPPPAPNVKRISGGENKIMISFSLRQTPDLERILLYRTTDRDRCRDLRLMPNPISDIPATPLSAQRGIVDLSAFKSISTVEKIYAADGFDPAQDFLQGQTSTEFLSATTTPINGIISGLVVEDKLPLVVVYRDQKNILQYSPISGAPIFWIDGSITGLVNYYYRAIAVKKISIRDIDYSIHSAPTPVFSGRAFDTSLPEIPVLEVVWDLPVVEPDSIGITQSTVRSPLVRWTSEHEVLIQVRPEGFNYWKDLSEWKGPGEHFLPDPSASMNNSYEYRAIVRKYTGVTVTGEAYFLDRFIISDF